ncbi:MAG: translation elongation factor 4, partial [Opitutaceae bacterium]
DLPSANLELCTRQLEDILTIPAEEAILASGKSGIGIEDILEAVVARVPAPRWSDYPQVRTLVFDSLYDSYRGVISYARVFSGAIKAGDQMLLMSNGVKSEVKEVGIFTPKMEKVDVLRAGDVGYVVSNIKSTADIKIGDTITLAQKPATEMLPGYKEVRPMVFCGLYPLESGDYEKLKAALGRLRLNDSAFVYSSESSVALGFGFRCGFLGLLHMEIIQERIRREHDVEIISTYPSVVYHVVRHGGELIEMDNPVNLPDPGEILEIREPTITASIIIPNDSMGDILALIMEKRGTCDHTDTLDMNRVMLKCVLPLNEILVDFNDRLKSITHGYGSMDYELGAYRVSDLVKMEILINGDPVDAFASIVHREKAESKGRELCEKLAEIIPPQMFKVAIQAAIGGKIIARDNVREMRKDVTAKCYGGDISRKRKLLDKQKEGKKKMKQIGKVSIPPDAFIKVLQNN